MVLPIQIVFLKVEVRIVVMVMNCSIFTLILDREDRPEHPLQMEPPLAPARVHPLQIVMEVVTVRVQEQQLEQIAQLL